MAPGQELMHCPRIGASRVGIADIGREKFQKAPLCPFARDDYGRLTPDEEGTSGWLTRA
jgi:hypothetical protein